jgi:hypothetical protein
VKAAFKTEKNILMKGIMQWQLLISFLLIHAMVCPFPKSIHMINTPADLSARAFGDKVFVYPSHDILATEGERP